MAQDLNASPIILGASLPLSGPQAEAGKEGQAVMQSQIDAINRQGGIGGHALQLKVLDDGYDPARAASNAKELIQSGAVALLNCWGTASCSAMLPVLQQASTPLVGAIAGSGAMRQQPGRYVFNLRASTQSEITAMLQQMTSLGQNKIAIVYQQDNFGQSSLEVARSVSALRGVQAQAEIAIDASGSNAPAIAKQLSATPDINGVIVLAGAPATIGLVTMARQAQVSAQFYNLAAQANRAVVQGLGSYTRGIVFTTLVPSPWRSSIASVKEYQDLLAAPGQPPASYLGLEVYLNTRSLVEGLRKAGAGVNRSNLLTALDGLGEMRYGPMSVRFAPNSRNGSTYVGLAMIDKSGQFRE